LTYLGLAIPHRAREHGFVGVSSPATIVVVERSAAVQELIDHALREAGHRVLVTRNPLEALVLARSVRIDVLVGDVATLDHERPGLIKQLRSIQPSLPVLYLGDRDWVDREDVEDASALRTPFSLDELQEAVAATLDRGTERR
jgi:two-component system, OmpR family, response regulator